MLVRRGNAVLEANRPGIKLNVWDCLVTLIGVKEMLPM